MTLDLDHIKTQLEGRKEELLTHSAESKDTRAPVELDQTTQGRLSRQDALMQQAMAEASERNRHTEVKRIDAALERLAAGDFGYCVICDEEIAEKRLQYDPAIATCIDCAK